MKTRVISAIILGIITTAFLLGGMLICPYISTLFVAVIAAAAVYELTNRVAGITQKTVWIGAVVYAFLTVFANAFRDVIPVGAQVLSVLYFVFAVGMTLKHHQSFGLSQIAMIGGLVIPVVFAFCYLDNIIKLESCAYYILLMLDFSWFCDMGAYFIGVRFGKHKLCPQISPKKTVEGVFGGFLFSIIGVLIITLSFAKTEHILATCLLTIPFCIVGMLGDLFASALKRAVGIKDFSNLIPGHGGIIDRTDSILLVAPLLYLCISFGVM